MWIFEGPRNPSCAFCNAMHESSQVVNLNLYNTKFMGGEESIVPVIGIVFGGVIGRTFQRTRKIEMRDETKTIDNQPSAATTRLETSH